MRQVTYDIDEAQCLWVGIEMRKSPKNEWGAMLRTSDKLKAHAEVDEDPESDTKGDAIMLMLPNGMNFPKFAGQMILSLERDELKFVIAICDYYEQQGGGASLARQVKSIRLKTDIAIKKMDEADEKRRKRSEKKAS